MRSDLFEHLSCPAIRIDRSGRILYANKHIDAALQNPPGEIAGRAIDELRFNGATANGLTAHLKDKIGEALDTGRNIDFSYKDKAVAIGFSIIVERSPSEEIASLCIIMQEVPEPGKPARPADEPQHSLSDLIPGPAFMLAPNCLVTGLNRSARDTIFGLDKERIVGMNLLDAVHHEDREGVQNTITTALHGEQESSCEARILHRDRMKYLWHTVSLRNIVTSTESSLLATAREITCCKQLQESLQISEAKFKQLFNGHSTVMLVIDVPTRTIIDANRAAAIFYGWPLEQLRTMRLDDLAVTSPEILEHEIAQIRRLKQKTVSVRHRRADGTIRDVEASTSLIEIQGNEVFYCIINDVTERIRVEKELLFSKSQLDFALEKSHIGWWSLNLEDGSLSRTLELARIFGYDATLSVWTYRQFLDHVFPEDRKRVDKIVRKARKNQTEWSFECRIRRTDGVERWILVAGGFQKDEAGKEHHMSGIVMDISERKFAEIELRENQMRFDLALRAARAGVWEMNIETGKAVWSHEVGRLLGLDQENLTPTFDLWMKAIHPEDRQSIINTISQTTREAMESNMEFRVCWPDGSIHWLMSRGQPVHNDNGKWVGYIGTIIDTTERRELLELAWQRESEYRSLFENMPNGFAYCQVLYDENGTVEDYVYLEVNGIFEKLLSLSNVIGKRATEIIPEIRTTDPELFRVSDRVVKSGQPEYFDYFLNALQEWFSFSVYSTKRDYFIVIFDIITKRKQIEQSLRKSEHKFRTITEQLSEVIFVTELNGIVSYISPAIEQIAGYSPLEVQGHAFSDFLDEEEFKKATEKFINAVTNQLQTEVFELKYRKKDGSELYAEISVRYYHESEGNEFSGLIGVIRDITQKKKDEEAKKQLEMRLRKSERLEIIGRLTGSIAHEFNNLLTPILGYAEIGTLNAQDNCDDAECFIAIRQAAERAKNLISQVMTFNKEHESTPAVVSVQSIIDEALKLLRPSIPANITIEQHIDKCCRNILIDPSKLHQVIVNLCTNAYQAIGENSGVITINLREVMPDMQMLKNIPGLKPINYVQIGISDTGIGMNEATIEHIFEPFFTTKPVDKGNGLGLSVVHGIITSYQGEITVESIPGEKTTFRIFLPLIDQEADQKPLETLPPKGSGHILIVDDEPVILKMLKTMLSKIGFETSTFINPLEALELFRQSGDQFDLVITDLTMPEMSGADLATELHNIRPKVPIILITGYGKELENNKSLDNHIFRKILKKPTRFNDLATAINEVIGSDQG
jgi:PAS domain S-box-containing protein